MWGVAKQAYYERGRALRTIEKDQIEGACACGYLTLKPTNASEQHNGGLTIARAKVQITHNGAPVTRLRGVQRYHQCNACVNNWK